MRSDWDLLESARSGDESAWKQLFQDHYPRLVRMAALMTGSRVSAKDLVQEAFLRVLRSHTNHREGTFKSYLGTITFRLALKEKQRGDRNESLEDGVLQNMEPSPLDQAEEQERQRHLFQVVQSLPRVHRDILVLRFYGEHSYEEIARLTGLPLGTVKSRIFYAVKECREKLHERGVL
jgi:RNA polymerase sigma-70 factor, ECF subfamily